MAPGHPTHRLWPHGIAWPEGERWARHRHRARRLAARLRKVFPWRGRRRPWEMALHPLADSSRLGSSQCQWPSGFLAGSHVSEPPNYQTTCLPTSREKRQSAALPSVRASQAYSCQRTLTRPLHSSTNSCNIGEWWPRIASPAGYLHSRHTTVAHWNSIYTPSKCFTVYDWVYGFAVSRHSHGLADITRAAFINCAGRTLQWHNEPA